MKENYRKMSKSDIREIKEGLKKYAAIEKRYDCMGVQSERFFKDCVIADLVGAEYVNTNNTGWDGQFEDGTPFENKNISVNAKNQSAFNLTFQDTSEKKLEELMNGVIAVNTFWENSRTPAFILVGNTGWVSAILKSTYRPKARKTCRATFIDCVNNYFKIVAVSYDKEETMEVITRMFPYLAKKLTFDDIYDEGDLKELVEDMK